MKLAEYLRQNTRQYHDMAEEKFSSQRIFDHDFSLEDYQYLLLGNYCLIEAFEDEVFSHISQYPQLELLLCRRRKLPSIKKELEQFAPLAVKPPATVTITNVYEAIGILYVIEGSTLGGNVIAKNLRRSERFKGFDFPYFGIYGQETGLMWKNFLTQIEAFIPEQHYPEVLKGAQLAYEYLLSGSTDDWISQN